MVRLYKKYIRHRIFNKMLLIYSLITIISIFLLTNIFITYYIDNELKNELNIHSEVIFNIEKTFEEQDNIVNLVTNGINTQPKVLNEINVLTSSTYEEYLTYKLDNYLVSNTKQIDLEYLIDTMLANRSDVLAVVINDKDKDYKNEIVLDYNKWYDIKNEKDDSEYIRKITKQIKNADTMYTIGYIDVYFDLTSLDKIMEKSNVKGSLIIFNEEDNIMFDSNKILCSTNTNEAKFITQMEEESIRNSENRKKIYPIIDVTEDAQTGYRYGSIITKNDLSVTEVKVKITSMAIMSIATIISITTIVIRLYSTKLKHMMKVIDKLKTGDLDARFDIKQEDDELDMIAMRIDEMSNSLQYNIEKNYISEVKQKQAELNALQAQIKPHFLYNTLEVIRMCALTSKNKEVAQMIYSLASMFRYSTYNNGTLVTLREEIKHCNMYLSLCNTRYKNMMSYEINIEDKYLDYLVPKFTIQPILENSINHGLKKMSSENVIVVDLFEDKEKIQIVVKDNGNGMNEEQLEKLNIGLVQNIQKSSSIGLMNINSRLKLRFGDDYGLEIHSVENEGTVVKVNIPILGENVEYV